MVDSILKNNKFLDGCEFHCDIIDYMNRTGRSHIDLFQNKIYSSLCISSEKEKCKKFISIMEFDGYKNKFEESWSRFICYEKRPFFEEEKKFRIIIEIPKNKLNSIIDNKSIYKFRVANGVFVPYLDVEFDRNAIAGLTIAPTLKSDLVGRSLDDFCRYNGLDPLNFTEGIMSSKIPVRF